MDMCVLSDIFFSYIHHNPQSVKRCAVGIGNQVYIVECDNVKYVLRCSTDDNAYADTIQWLTSLAALDIPVPKVLHYGKYGEYNFIILNFIEGQDLGLVYPNLSKSEKKKIAKAVIEIQRKVSHLQLSHIDAAWSWYSFLNDILERADMRITQNGYFDNNRVKQLKNQISILDNYFSNVKPKAYLDDISTKNLLIHNGQVSGIIDIDWIGVGDSLTFIALTYVALVNMDYETDYIDYLLEEKGCSDLERKAFLFYCLVYCVDFMGERGMQFGDKKIDVNDEIVNKLNQIYDDLWKNGVNRVCNVQIPIYQKSALLYIQVGISCVSAPYQGIVKILPMQSIERINCFTNTTLTGRDFFDQARIRAVASSSYCRV